MTAIFGAKQPHPQSLTVGGITSVMDVLDPTRLGEWKSKFETVKDFVERAYYADIVMAAGSFNKEQSVLKGCGLKNFIAHEEILLSKGKYLLSSGVVLNGDLNTLHKIDEKLIKEEVTHSWYQYEGKEIQLHPYDGKLKSQWVSKAYTPH
ncbi:hypothetical protein HSHS1_16320 [Helicobacter suis HS1]|nr:hypothetical protein HSHS1_16320 [Helicobacter suis HS1]